MDNTTNLPYLPYGRQTIVDADIAAVIDVLKSPFITQGPVVPAFEYAIAKKVDAEFSIAVNSATSALHIACLSLDLQPGNWLWTTPITFVASANCGLYCGAYIDFVDINLSTGLIDVKLLEKKLQLAKSQNKLPKVLVAVHLAGTSCEMQKIAELSKLYGFRIIEDASHAIGGFYKNEPVGCCKYSDITVFSFHPVKIITTGEGGAATTNDKNLAVRMRTLRSHGIVKDHQSLRESNPSPWSYEQQYLGFNYRMTDMQAALGLSQIERLDDIVEERNLLLNYYVENMPDLPLQFLEIPSNCKSSVHLAVIKLFPEYQIKHRQLFQYLRDSGIGVQLHYSPVHLQPYYQELGFCESSFEQSEIYSKTAMSIPLYPGLSSEDLDRVIKTISNFF